MSSPSRYELDFLAQARSSASKYGFYPRGTVRCVGDALFRYQAARDLGCLLDLAPDVDAWSCLPLALTDECDLHVPDLAAYRGSRITLMDVTGAGREVPDWVADVANDLGYSYEAVPAARIAEGPRALNCRDLLRYAKHACPLGDRVRLLAGLDEQGSMTVIECLGVFREARPIASLASLALHRFVEIDLDEARIGPETAVRRIRP